MIRPSTVHRHHLLESFRRSSFVLKHIQHFTTASGDGHLQQLSLIVHKLKVSAHDTRTEKRHKLHSLNETQNYMYTKIRRQSKTDDLCL